MVGVSAGALALSLSACTPAVTGEGEESAGSPSNTEIASGTKFDGIEKLGSGSWATSQLVQIGESVTFEDGITISLEGPVPLQNVQTGNAREAIELDVRIQNESSEVFSTGEITISIISEGELGTILGYDTAEPLTLPDSPVGVGQDTGMKLGCEVNNRDDLRVVLAFADGRGDITFVTPPTNG
ncbi:MAG: hypothetical protein Q4D87_01155 [Actinomycetaceae bacterium]|nr:hypothetical protein [Actinomycetaceae bacterium]